MRRADELRARLDGLARDLVELLPDEPDRGAHDAIDRARSALTQPFYVVVCGEYSRGKSTLLNALMGRPGLFPEGGLTTSVVTQLAWGAQERAFVTTHPDPATSRPGRRFEVPLSEVSRYATEEADPGNAQAVAVVEMFAPIPQLRSGLVLVDTPGISSIRAAHTEATYAFLGTADAVLFVTGAREPLTAYELAFLHDVVAQCPTFTAVVAQIDDVPDWRPIVDDARTKIATAVRRNRADVTVLPVSAYRAFDAAAEHDPALRQRSGLPELEEVLWGQLTIGCEKARISAALSGLAQALEHEAAPVANAWQELAEADAGVQSAELTRLELQLDNLRRGESAWLQHLDKEFERRSPMIRQDMAAAFQHLVLNIRTQTDLYGDDQDPDDVVQRAQRAMIDAALEAERALSALCGGLAADAAALAQIELVTAQASQQFWSPPQVVRQGTPSGTPSIQPAQTLKLSVRTGVTIAGVGATVGGVIGGLVAPGVGNAAGALIGGVVGHLAGWVVVTWEHIRTARADHRRKIAHRLTERLPKLVEQAARDADDRFVAEAARRLEVLRDTLTRGIALDRASLTRSITLVDRTLTADASARAALRRELAPRRERHQQLANQLSELGDDVGSLESRPR
ncbi:dynamin family protein [Catellatospora tritici]|uniref:dynamin family protein n=1 Tax=Catellatospora tritici TaxID=2851566 RepID=UPI001C2D1BD6|nr:dynamin family protein [Catellatospora tritici]MBV1852688.1 dynamin family protein [Catellatospora tritici]